MLNINYDIFNENLLLTQAYCDRQLSNASKNISALFRSINPAYNNIELFDFSLNKIPTAQQEKFFYAFGVNWKIDPYDTANLFEELFEQQLKLKKDLENRHGKKEEYEGQIFVFEVDGTLIDGAAAVSSHGLLDDYNCPPIDTWFYLTNDDDNRVLFAWIPKELVSYADDGISVNPEGCIRWFTEYTQETAKVKQSNKRTKFVDFISGLPKFFQR